MFNGSMKQRIGRCLAVAALLGCSLAMAQSEPTLKQVYEAAQAGRLDQAQSMMRQVLVAHPNSAKAHFVAAELSARQGKMSQARESLAAAEKLAPGLPFAKPEAVSALRAQLAGKAGSPSASGGINGLGNWPVNKPAASAPVAPAAPAYLAPPAAASTFPWGMALLLGGGALALGVFMFRRKSAPVATRPAPYANPGTVPGGFGGPNGFGGPQNFGMGGAANNPAGMGPMAPAAPQPAGSGLGGRVMGGLATGLAVGAGVMAAEAIGKSLFNHDKPPAHQAESAAPAGGFDPAPANSDLGGENFGVNDTSSWDDGGAVDSGGGGDWDS